MSQTVFQQKRRSIDKSWNSTSPVKDWEINGALREDDFRLNLPTFHRMNSPVELPITKRDIDEALTSIWPHRLGFLWIQHDCTDLRCEREPTMWTILYRELFQIDLQSYQLQWLCYRTTCEQLSYDFESMYRSYQSKSRMYFPEFQQLPNASPSSSWQPSFSQSKSSTPSK